MPNPSRSKAGVAALWAVAALVVVGHAAFLVASIAPGWQDAPPTATVMAAPRANRGNGQLLLAGSGSNLALTRALVAACTPPGNPTPTIAESIGSTGGVRALLDGAIDGALISRPLREEEARHGLTVVSYARVPVVLAAHPDVPHTNWQASDWIAVFAGQRPLWPDGRPLEVLQREPGDSSHLAVARVLPEFARVDADNARTRRWRTLYHDAALLREVTRTPGAVGLSDLASIRLQSAAVSLPTLAGVQPTASAVQRGQWPFSKDFALVLRRDAPASLHQLAACLRGPLAQPVLQRADALGL